MNANQENLPREPAHPGVSRRKFLGGAAGLTAAALAGGGLALEPLFDSAAVAEAAANPSGDSSGSSMNQRRARAMQVRMDAAKYNHGLGTVQHPTNGDEARYPSRIGNYHKGLPHNSINGEVDAAAYQSLLAAIASSDPADYEAIQTTGAPASKLTNPLSGLAFDMEGADSWALAVPAPPALASKEQAGEMTENYWMALLRDVNFLDYASSPAAAAASADLNSFGADFKGPKIGGAVTPQSLFRDIAPGATVGPYISQFMWLPTPFGAQQVDARVWTLAAGSDHLQTWADYLAAQNGFVPASQQFAGVRRYIINGRDLSAFVHIDVLYQAYFNACLILMTPPDSSDNGGGIGCPFNPTNPYLESATQTGFCTFGLPNFKAMVAEVATRALKNTWHKKWQIHRRLRPEHYAGLVEVQLNQQPGRYDGILHSSLFSSGNGVLDKVASYNGGSHLLPIAFPEGCPTHPSYTAGHATVAGACVTFLKAVFDESFVIENPVVPDPTGTTLLPYSGPPLTVGGELNKLASNIGSGRNIAAMHWRTDAHASFRLGQAITVSILRDQKATYAEKGVSYRFTGFDGETIVI